MKRLLIVLVALCVSCAAWAQTTYRHQPVSRVQDNLLRPILTEMDRELLRLRSVVTSGSSAVLNNLYLFKPGLGGGQIAIGGTAAADNLVLRPNATSSTQTGGVFVEYGAISSSGSAFGVRPVGGSSVLTVGKVGQVAITDPTAYVPPSGVQNLLDLNLVSDPGVIYGGTLMSIRSGSSTNFFSVASTRSTVLIGDSSIPVASFKGRFAAADNIGASITFTQDGQANLYSTMPLLRLVGDASTISDLFQWRIFTGSILGGITPDGNLYTRNFDLNGSTSGVLTHTVPATVTSHTLTWPAANASGDLTNNGSGTLSWTAPAGGITGLANPTDSIGVAKVNGSATTAMRSDAAPPLKTSISPTWSGTHTFLTPIGIASGGTGQTSKTPAFDALAPTTTAGDFIYNDGTDNVALPIGDPFAVLQVTDEGVPVWAQIDINNISNVFTNTFAVADIPKTNTTLTATTLGFGVFGGSYYEFRSRLFVDASAVGGLKFDMNGGTATVSSVIWQLNVLNNGTSTYALTTRNTALATASGVAGPTSAYVEITGILHASSTGTVYLRFAQNAASGTSTLLTNSYMVMTKISN